MKLGASEALVVNGNVDGFSILNNSIHDCNNIAIDVIGFENVSVAPFDQARNGVIQGNVITRIDSRGNPAYGNDRSANGIYVDGGKSITINLNTISLCNIGIELASEHAGQVTSNVIVTNNSVKSCHTVGLSLGGYDSRRGGTQNCVIKQNTIRGNDTDKNGSGEIQVQFFVKNNEIQKNVIWSTGQNVLISSSSKTSSGNSVDYNTYYSPGGPNDSIWQWNNVEYDNFTSYKTTTRNDLHSTAGLPPQ